MATKKNQPKATAAKKAAPKKATQKGTSKISASSMVIPLPTNHLIPKTDGAHMITDLNRCLSTNPIPFDLPLAFNFNRNIFEQILSDPDCVGVRIYYGLNDQNQLSLVLTGVDDQNNDLYLFIEEEGKQVKAGVGDMGQACPLYPKETTQLP